MGFNEIVAAASRVLTGRGGKSTTGGNNGGSSLAWQMFETVPEVGRYAEYISNTMQGATLFAGRRGPDGTIEAVPKDSRAAQLVASIAGGPEGQAELLGDFGSQLAVTGDSWLIIIPNAEADSYADDRWVVLSSEEVTVQRGTVKAVIDGEEIVIPEYDPDVPQDADVPVAVRVWKRSPRRRDLSTSPVIRSLNVLQELQLLNAAVAAIAKSRITGRGLLLVPAGARFPTQPGQDSAEDSLLDTFIEVASTAMQEPDSAAATVPIVLELPGDLISGVKWLQFSSEFDAMAIQLRDEAIRRFAIGADVPAEVLLGLGDSNHWGAWALTAEALRMGTEPKLAIVCNALSTEWLQPLLDAEGDPDAFETVVWYDTASLRASSNKGGNAIEAYKENLISAEAARRELGYTEKDAPGQQDTPDTANDQEETATERNAPVEDSQTMPDTLPIGDMADQVAASSAVLDSFTADTNAALAEAVDGLVWTALAVAGRKLVLTPAVPRPSRSAARDLVAAGTVHVKHSVTMEAVRNYRLLENAWVRVPAVAKRYGLDPLELTEALDDYTSALLVSGLEHDFDNVPRLLAQIKVNR